MVARPEQQEAAHKPDAQTEARSLAQRLFLYTGLIIWVPSYWTEDEESAKITHTASPVGRRIACGVLVRPKAVEEEGQYKPASR